MAVKKNLIPWSAIHCRYQYTHTRIKSFGYIGQCFNVFWWYYWAIPAIVPDCLRKQVLLVYQWSIHKTGTCIGITQEGCNFISQAFEYWVSNLDKYMNKKENLYKMLLINGFRNKEDIMPKLGYLSFIKFIKHASADITYCQNCAIVKGEKIQMK